MVIIDLKEAVKLTMNSLFIKSYSRRGKKGSISDRGARVKKSQRWSYNWLRVRMVASMSALPIAMHAYSVAIFTQ